MAKERIVILGGGISALATAYELTSTPDWQDHYDITIYQMGWRLGGKVASSRNPEKLNRIEDTGLHFCPGFYENVFKIVRSCYTELTGDPQAWLKAFATSNQLVSMEANPKGGWYPPWVTNFEPNDKYPGDPEPLLQDWEYFLVFVEKLTNHHTRFVEKVHLEATDPGSSLRERMGGATLNVMDDVMALPMKTAVRELSELRDRARREEAVIILEILEELSKIVGRLLGWLNDFIKLIEKIIDPIVENNLELRRDWIMLQIGIAIVRGILFDEVLFKGFRPLDDYDFIEWLERNGAPPEASRSVQILGIYEGLFAFEKGNLEKPNLAAGVALYTMLRWFITYRGAIVYRPVESTGVAIFSPLYAILKKRGVQFKFFHRVRSVNLPKSGDKRDYVESITIGRQVDLTVPEYDPVVTEHWTSIGSYQPQYWPSEPLWSQINPEQADELRKRKVNLEHYSSDHLWKDVETFDLRYGEDFDRVVLAIPIGALPCVVSIKELAEVNPRWQPMVDTLQTVTTQGFQLWVTETTPELGWETPPEPIIGTYQHPYPDWGDMTLLLNPEEKAAGVQSLSHFAVVLPENSINDQGCDLTPADHERAAGEIAANAVKWLNHSIAPLWPNATSKDNPEGLNWNLVYDFGERQVGDAKFASQYVSPNIDPSIRYDLSLKGSIKYRLKPTESGFSNMMIVGSWTDNGLNSSLMEGAVMSGMIAASAISEAVTGTAHPPLKSIIGLIEYGDEPPLTR